MAEDRQLAFHRKYRPSKMADYIGNKKLKETAMAALRSKVRPQTILLEGASGCGKAQPLDSLVLTTDGYKRMGDIEIGDEVFTSKGNRGKVSGIYPQGVRPVYRINLSDRTYIDVSDEHLNSVYRYNQKKKVREDFVISTKDLIGFLEKSPYKLRIDVPVVDWEEQDVSLDPYLVGALIGNGSLSSNNFIFSNSEEDIVERVKGILLRDFDMTLNLVSNCKTEYRIKSKNSAKYVFTYKGNKYFGCENMIKALEKEGYPKFKRENVLNMALGVATKLFKKYPELRGTLTVDINESSRAGELRGLIKELKLNRKSVEKVIPREYMFNSKEVRLELLRGLFDTSGSISKTGMFELSTSSKQLSEDFAFLVRSLGIRDTIVEVNTGYKLNGVYKERSKGYRHYLKVPNDIIIFKSKKHYARYYKKWNEPIRNIVSIERIEDKECQCIMVDHEDHTYISDFFIPTHNTTFARLLAKEYRCENRDEETGACGECISCKELEDYITTGDTGNLVDIKEVDIASEGGKKDVDAVLEDAMYPSYGGQWKIFIFDECHMATKQAQNRMLKIAEEPPENVLLIFCTTDPEMMLETLLNRCQLRLRVTKPEVKELGGLLKGICLNENIDYDIKGVNLIANRSGLTIRRALVLLQDIVNQKNSAKYTDVVDVLDEISDSTMFDFYRKLISHDTMGYVTLLHKIKVKMELKRFIESLLEFTKRGVLIINGVNLDGMTDGELKSYKALFSKFSVEQIGVLLEKLLSLRDGDIELKLLMMGYTGLLREHEDNNSLDLLEVKSSENELVEEKEEHLKQTEKKFEINEEVQKERVEELQEAMDFDDIMDTFFGNVEIKDLPN